MEHKTIKMDALDAKVTNVESENPNGEFEAILVTTDVDREDESFAEKAFDPLPESIPIHKNHDLTDPIGRGTPEWGEEPGQIIVKGYYSAKPAAQEVRQDVKDGIIDSMSVGFIKATREKVEGKTVITTASMLEGTFTAIPSNVNARVLAAKSIEGKVGARNSSSDTDRLQTIHDLSVENGAACEGKEITEAEGKTIDGSYEDDARQLTEALREKYGSDDKYVWVRATFDDSVIYEMPDDDGNYETFKTTYTKTDDGYTFGDPEEVDVTEVVSSKEVTAEAASEETADAAADEELKLRARALSLVGEAL